MIRPFAVLFAIQVTFHLLEVAWLQADEPRSQLPTTQAPNAAVIYWQAFAAMPSLSDAQQKNLESAISKLPSSASQELNPFLEHYQVALRELHRAAAVEPCDWQLDELAGPNMLLPHLQKARELAKVAMLRAQLRLAADDTDAALNDISAVLKLAHDCGRSPILISLLVDATIEKQTIDVLATHLPSLTTAQLERLLQTLKNLPSTATVVDCLRHESTIFVGWIERTIQAEAGRLNDPGAGGKLLLAICRNMGLGEELVNDEESPDATRRKKILSDLKIADVRAAVEQLRQDYQQLIRIMSLDDETRAKQLTQAEADLVEVRKLNKPEDVLRYLSALSLPSVARISEREQQLIVRRHLLEQAIRVQQHGPTAIESINGRKVEYSKLEHGFELRCGSPEKAEVLKVGGAQ